MEHASSWCMENGGWNSLSSIHITTTSALAAGVVVMANVRSLTVVGGPKANANNGHGAAAFTKSPQEFEDGTINGNSPKCPRERRKRPDRTDGCTSWLVVMTDVHQSVKRPPVPPHHDGLKKSCAAIKTNGTAPADSA